MAILNRLAGLGNSVTTLDKSVTRIDKCFTGFVDKVSQH